MKLTTIHPGIRQWLRGVALAAVLVAAGSGCNTGHHSAGTYIDDRAVTSRVKGALDDQSVYKYPNVQVSTFNGVVQLSGFVESASQKEQAAEVASRVDGVRQVLNSITIEPPALSPTGRENGAAPIVNQ